MSWLRSCLLHLPHHQSLGLSYQDCFWVCSTVGPLWSLPTPYILVSYMMTLWNAYCESALFCSPSLGNLGTFCCCPLNCFGSDRGPWPKYYFLPCSSHPTPHGEGWQSKRKGQSRWQGWWQRQRQLGRPTPLAELCGYQTVNVESTSSAKFSSGKAGHFEAMFPLLVVTLPVR